MAAEQVMRLAREINRDIMRGVDPADFESVKRVLSRIVENATRSDSDEPLEVPA